MEEEGEEVWMNGELKERRGRETEGGNTNDEEKGK